MVKGVGELFARDEDVIFLLLQYDPSAQIDCEIQQWQSIRYK